MSILLETDLGWVISHGKYFDRIKVSEKCNISTNEDDSVCKNEVSVEDTQNFKYFRLDPSLFEISEPFKEKLGGKKLHGLKYSEMTRWIMKTSEKILGSPEAQTIFSNDDDDDGSIGRRNQIELKESTGSSDSNNRMIDIYSDKCAQHIIVKNDEDKPTLSPTHDHWPRNNFKAVATTERFFEAVKNIKWPKFHGQNPDNDLSIISGINDCNENVRVHQFIFPHSTKFYCNDVSKIKSIICQNSAKNGTKETFDLIVIDPPWWNKFIRRKKRKQHEAGYEMITNTDIVALPIKDILNDHGLVVIWCTNAKSHQDAIINEMFPAWGVELHITLYWLKVTKSGVPICPFNSENKKQPYEVVLIGSRATKMKEPISKESYTKLVISVPSSINSHKPPLINILQRMYPDKRLEKNLEVFARYLTPGFTSFGNEVIKLQHISLYEEV